MLGRVNLTRNYRRCYAQRHQLLQ